MAAPSAWKDCDSKSHVNDHILMKLVDILEVRMIISKATDERHLENRLSSLREIYTTPFFKLEQQCAIFIGATTTAHKLPTVSLSSFLPSKETVATSSRPIVWPLLCL